MLCLVLDEGFHALDSSPHDYWHGGFNYADQLSWLPSGLPAQLPLLSKRHVSYAEVRVTEVACLFSQIAR